MRMLFVGNPGEVHVARHLAVAAERQGHEVGIADNTWAYRGPSLLRKLLWHWDRRPLRLSRFSRSVIAMCAQLRPHVVVTTGVCPLNARSIMAIRSLGARAVNQATDDPFNPAHRANWFIESLPNYDTVFSPRRANLGELKGAGCADVRYLPFAFAPDQHFPVSPLSDCASDVVFVGGADIARVAMLKPLIDCGLRVALYGGYWDRYALTRRAHRGIAQADAIRSATASAKVCLVLVRRANRDGHVMRSFEAAACGGCLLVEDTSEHREIFADSVTYFSTADDMVVQTRDLLADPERRRHSAEASYQRIAVYGKNSYADRLQTILSTIDLA